MFPIRKMTGTWSSDIKYYGNMNKILISLCMMVGGTLNGVDDSIKAPAKRNIVS